LACFVIHYKTKLFNRKYHHIYSSKDAGGGLNIEFYAWKGL